MPSTERAETETELKLKLKTKTNWNRNWNWNRNRNQSKLPRLASLWLAWTRLERVVSWLRLANCKRMCGKVFWEINSNAKARAKAMVMKLHEAPVCAKAIACYWNRSKLIYHQWNNIWEAARRQMMIMPKMEHKNATKLCQRSVSNWITEQKIKKRARKKEAKSKRNRNRNQAETRIDCRAIKRKRSKLCLSLRKNYLIYLSIAAER